MDRLSDQFTNSTANQQTDRWIEGTKDERKERKGRREKRIMKVNEGIDGKGEPEGKKYGGSIFHRPYLMLALSIFPALF